MKSKLFSILFLALSNAIILDAVESNFSKSSNQQFIYGEITTVDDEKYKGHIRWGDEEVFWFDFFNSTKIGNENSKWLSKSEEQALSQGIENKNWWGKVTERGWKSDGIQSHVFACQFGDIKSIEFHASERVVLTFKNGNELELKGGSNDIGTKVQLSDDELGILKLDWKRIKKVEFMQAPNNKECAFGKPLYGIVKTIRGEFEGFLQWDHDERLDKDVLNGRSSDGDMDIEFGKIKSIRRSENKSLVILNSGRKFELGGTNDVNNGNRGIIVSTPNYGRVDIPWDEFVEIEFRETPENVGVAYDDYQGSKKLKATVNTFDDEFISGEIVFDLDEALQLEMLNGNDDHVEYFIPFGAIKEITPMNRKESKVTLSNGESFLLDGKVDVNEDNDGVLVYFKTSSDKPKYVAWSEVQKITFE